MEAAGTAEQLTAAASESEQQSEGSASPSGVDYADAAVQTVETADAGVQCEPPVADAQELQQQLASSALAEFLWRAVPICEAALQQNELADALQDEFAGEATVPMAHSPALAPGSVT